MSKRANATIRAYKAAFSSAEGKLVLADMASRYFLFAGTQGNVNAANGLPLSADYCEGQRNVVLEILHMMEAKPEPLAVLEMVRDGLHQSDQPLN